MREKLKVVDAVSCAAERNRGFEDALKFKGTFHVEHWRGGELLERVEARNTPTNEGINQDLGIMFHADTQLTTWYIGMVDNASFSAFALTDTMGSHPGWVESVAYTGANRPAWGPGAASGRSITNATPVSFTMTGSGTMKGVFITSDNTLSGTAGKLWATAAFASLQPWLGGDVLKVTYTVSA